MWPFLRRKKIINSADDAIAEASRFSEHNKWRKAYDVHGEAIRQMSLSATPSKGLARLYYERAVMAHNIGTDARNSGNRAASEDWYAKSHQDYDLALERDPSDWRPWLGKANLLARDQSHFREALPYYDKAAELNPQDAGILNNRGLTNVALGDIDGALRDFKTAIALEPSSADAYSNIGTIHYVQGRFGEAAAWYEKAAALNPLDPEYRQYLEDARNKM